ncbi:MAG: hypothetical protein ACFBZ8_06675 [Opitutales bacterium]
MNRSLLLVVCDFLLLSILALVDFDDVNADDEETAPVAQTAEEVMATVEEDIIALLQLDLQSQQEANEALSQTNDSLSEELAEKQVELQQKARDLATTTSQLQQTESRLQEASTRAEELLTQQTELEKRQRALEQEKAKVESERRLLAERVVDAQSRLNQTQEERLALSEELGRLKSESAVSTERVRLLQRQLSEKEKILSQAQEEVQSLETEKTSIEREKTFLETELRVAETEKSALSENLNVARGEVELVRREKQEIQQQAQKLAEGVTSLAESSEQIKEEVASLQTLSLNAIFEQYKERVVRLNFIAVERNFGSRTREYSVRSVLVSDGRETFVVFHRRDTPLESDRKVNFVENLAATVELAGQRFRVSRLHTLKNDSRLLAVRVDPALIERMGLTPFETSQDPGRFSSAVLVNANENYYGETEYTIFTENDRYLAMDRKIFSGLRGEFSPEAGDIVFSRHGQIIGFMANGTYAVRTEIIVTGDTISLGSDFSQPQTEALVARLENRTGALSRELR